MKVLLASFDPVPAPKGASAHIRRNHRILSDAGHQVSMVTLGDEPLPGLRHRVLHPSGNTWLHRARDFGERLKPLLDGFDVVHVRSPFEGLSVRHSRIVYEVNAFYSIELPCRYPALANHPGFRDRMRAAELLLLERADTVITPSQVTATYLEDLGVQDVKRVPNCPSIPVLPHVGGGEVPHLVYIGTFAPWQGMHQVLRVLSRLTDRPWRLSILSASKDRWVRKLIAKLELTDRVTLHAPLGGHDLGHFLTTADIGLAPLTPGERNLVQGCMPVKLLDYARAGLRILAPDLQVVTDVLGKDAMLYRAWTRSHMTEVLAALLAGAGDKHPVCADEDDQRDALLEAYRT